MMSWFVRFPVFGVALLLSVGCSKSSRIAPNKGESGANFLNTDCSVPLAASITRLGDGEVKIGDVVSFEVRISGCSGQYLLNGVPVDANSQFQASYTEANSEQQESVVVMDANFPDQVITVQSDIFVVAGEDGQANTGGTSPIGCELTVSAQLRVLPRGGSVEVNFEVRKTTEIPIRVFEVAGSTPNLFDAEELAAQISTQYADKQSFSLNVATAGEHSIDFKVQSEQGAQAQCTALLVLEAPPAVSVEFSEAPVVLPETRIGSTSVKPVVLTNTGELSIRVLASVFEGQAGFRVVGGSCTDGDLVPPNGSCEFELAFSPVNDGATEADFKIAFLADATLEAVVPVSGMGKHKLQVGIGYHYTCASKDGNAKCWGFNSYGQVGNGTRNHISAPTQVTGMEQGVLELAVGGHHACAVKGEKRELYCWGLNTNGQLGDGSTQLRSAPNKVPGLEGVVKVALGYYHSCAVTLAGKLYCWGYNGYGQLGNGDRSRRLEPTEVPGMENGVTDVAASKDYTFAADHTCAIQRDQLKCWGYNRYGQLGDGTAEMRLSPVEVSGMDEGVTHVELGRFSSMAIHKGRPKSWGFNGYAGLGLGDRTNRAAPTNIPNLTNGVSAIAMGNHHGCAVQDSKLQCWGYNYYGDVGIGSRVMQTSSVEVTTLTDKKIVTVATGSYGTCAFNEVGKLWCWGYNGYGGTGNGTQVTSHAPVEVAGY